MSFAYRLVETPIGTLLLAATRRGLCRVAFESVAVDAELARLADALGAAPEHRPAALDDAATQLDEYFAGRRREFALPLDLTVSTGHRAEVQRGLADIPYGETWSYGELAAHVGNPRAARAAGTACGANPLPVVLPCHRVVRSGGTLGQYGGGLAVKRALLAVEGVVYPAAGGADARPAPRRHPS